MAGSKGYRPWWVVQEGEALLVGSGAKPRFFAPSPGETGMTTPEPLALYIHWPFCLSRCPYCDFNAHVREVIPQSRFRAALRRELAWEAYRLGRRPLRSIFLGGGTPSTMEPETVAHLLEDARALFDASPDLEITLEANPTSVETDRLSALREAGVNRISLGVQSLDPEALALLGRRHSTDQAVAALEIARRIFPRISFDLIYARPGQTVPAWRAELRRALTLAADHLSLYQLTVEPGTAFEALHRRGGLVLPDEDTGAALYDATREEAARFGLLPYEISNYARPGAESRHNLQYWRYGDYAGIGPGAHGRITLNGRLHATRRHRAPEPWAECVERDGHALTDDDAVDAKDQRREMLLMGLRLMEGVSADRFHARTGLPAEGAPSTPRRCNGQPRKVTSLGTTAGWPRPGRAVAAWTRCCRIWWFDTERFEQSRIRNVTAMTPGSREPGVGYGRIVNRAEARGKPQAVGASACFALARTSLRFSRLTGRGSAWSCSCSSGTRRGRHCAQGSGSRGSKAAAGFPGPGSRTARR